jgi:hypothetical protein
MQMKESAQDVSRAPMQQYHLVSKAKARKERKHRRWQSIKEGWDVSGPRWRIGWGGLDETGEEDAPRPDRRH